MGSDSVLGAGKGRWEVASKRASDQIVWYRSVSWCCSTLTSQEMKASAEALQLGTMRSVSTFSLAQGLPANKT